MKKTAAGLLLLIVVMASSIRILPGDTITVDVYSASGVVLSRTVLVDDEGKASLPYVGSVKVEGRDEEYIRKLIQEKASEFLPSSVVVVSVRPGPRLVYFHGRIKGYVDLRNLPPDQRRLSNVLAVMGGVRETPRSVEIIRGEKLIDLDFSKFLQTGDRKYNPVMEPGDIVYIPRRGFVGVFGAVKIPGVFEIEEKMSLLDALAKAGADLGSEEVKVIRVYMDGSAKEFKPSDLDEMQSYELSGGEVIYVQPYHKVRIYVIGDVSSRVVSSEGEDMNLRKLISSIGLKFQGRKYEVKVYREGRVMSELTVERAEEVPDLKLRDGDVVSIREILQLVYSYGKISKTVDLSVLPKDQRRLSNVLALLGLKADIVKLVRNGKSRIVEFWKYLESGDESENPRIEPGDEIVVVGMRKAMLSGDVPAPGYYELDEDETLLQFLLKHGVKMSNEFRVIVKLKRSGVIRTFRWDETDEMKGVEMKNGDVVEVESVNPVFVYVGGIFNGKVTFDFDEKPTLRSLLFKLTGVDLQRDLVVFVSSERNVKSFAVEDILRGATDTVLKAGDYVYITPYAFGSVQVGYESAGKYVLKRVGILSVEETLWDVLIRSGSLPKYTWKAVLLRDGKSLTIPQSSLTQLKAQDGDVLLLTTKDLKYVYVTGDLSAVVTFKLDERITRESLLAKLGIGEDKVREISGKLEDGGVIRISLKKIVRVYTFGTKTAMVTFSYDEDPLLSRLVSKMGGLQFPNRNLTYDLEVFRSGKVVFRTRLGYEGLERDCELEDGDYVKITPSSIEVVVFGFGVRQGKYILPKGSHLRDLLIAMGGVPRGYGMLRIFREGKVEEVRVSPQNIPDVLLQDGDTIVFGDAPSDFVYVFGDVANPGAVYIGGEPRDLLMVLSMSGGLVSWGEKRKVKIIHSDGSVDEYDLEYEKLNKVKVYGGDAIYVLPRSFNRVYVLGAVNNPTVVFIDRETTLLEAIMRAGGFKKTALRDKVYVFRGGVKGSVEIYDLSWVGKGKLGKNPKLSPGDIVYVTDNPLVSINDMISLIVPMVNFINSSLNLYMNVRNAIGM